MHEHVHATEKRVKKQKNDLQIEPNSNSETSTKKTNFFCLLWQKISKILLKNC